MLVIDFQFKRDLSSYSTNCPTNYISIKVRVSNGLPAGTAYKHSGEIDPKIKESPPKDIVNKIRNTIESPSRVKSPPKPRCKLKIQGLIYIYKNLIRVNFSPSNFMSNL